MGSMSCCPTNIRLPIQNGTRLPPYASPVRLKRMFDVETGPHAGVVKLADTQVLEACAVRRMGSSPFSRTIYEEIIDLR